MLLPGVAEDRRLPIDFEPGSGCGRCWTQRKLVRRGHLMTIAAAWVITVPATAAMAAGLFFLIDAVQR